MVSVKSPVLRRALCSPRSKAFFRFDDDIRNYLPELPSYGHTITLRQILHRTSRSRDFFDPLVLLGPGCLRVQFPRARLRNSLCAKRGLNNVPGDEWVYSNTNYSALELPVGHAPVQTKLGIS
jgi:CubicO group peptidase (beta-lactamase class C family)